jgi:hypothetical protein
MTVGNASKLIRRTHMYLALFLAPWMTLYAVSTLVMNHTRSIGARPQSFTRERELSYTNSEVAGARDHEVARQILVEQGLDGPFNVQGSLKQGRLVIFRQEPVALRRVTYVPGEHRLTIEREDFQMGRFLKRMHTRSGFTEPYASAKGWGFLVDAVVVAMVFWVASGAWMWWEIRPARLPGGILVLAGFALYAVLVALL